MKMLPHIVLAEPVIHGVLKLAFDDGFEGVVDLRPLIAKGKVFAWLQAPAHFADLRIDEHGHSLSWTDATGYVIDLSADSLRRDAERQAEAHRLLAG
ncbi:MAG TPA: DUF2442 domain-containing protein [Beijerinckiaceae bacterium]|jgi:hypothetical protein|nr:DUF2442 domain-containing protein [Beijerinckiaceae bacterium]